MLDRQRAENQRRHSGAAAQHSTAPHTSNASVFVNRTNGHRETISKLAPLWALLFGGIYLLFKGLWAHVLIWAVVAIGLSVAIGVPIPMFIASIAYAIMVQGLLEKKYLREGWVPLHVYMNAQKAPASKPVTRAVAPAVHVSSSPFLADELRKLAELHKEGVLTADEFNAQKAKLLK